MKTIDFSALTPLSANGGQALTDYALILGLILLVCFFTVGELGVQVANLLALVLPAFTG